MRLIDISHTEHRPRGQALVEFALVFPIFALVLMAIISFGLYVFYNQQLENAAREAARYAAVHSASQPQCPTVSNLDPPDSLKYDTYNRCDSPSTGWPRMTNAARSKIWGMNSGAVAVAACWSGFVDGNGNADALPTPPNTFQECTIQRHNPRTESDLIACPPAPSIPYTIPPTALYKADGDDTASSLSAYDSVQYPTTVTVYACFNWTPPLAGFVLMPDHITIRAVVSQALQRQQ